ncbi:hypothetical protein ACAF76_015685 [Brevibacillus sp. TJ4]|uniref:hypothetical protein n=1 Tax=Brevibacillus sp. TJ4 TaxID=3234853 RepID=UPI0037CDCBBA
MRKVRFTVKLILAALLLTSCATNSPSTSTQKTINEEASWAYFYVKIENRVYIISEDADNLVEKENIGEQIGTVQEKYDHEEEEQQSTLTIVSNYLEEGTKLFAIKDVDPSIHIAIEKDEGIFIKATEKNSVPKKQKTN